MHGGNESVRCGHWEKVLTALKSEVGEAVFKSWLKPLALACADGPEVVIAAPTRFMRDWVERHYLDRMKALWVGLDPSVRAVEVRVIRTPVPRAVAAPRPQAANGEAPPASALVSASAPAEVEEKVALG